MRDRRPRRRERPRALRAVVVLLITVVPGAALGVVGWERCGRYGERCREAGQLFPVHEPGMPPNRLVMRDLSGNGVIDTWVHRDASGIRQIDVDLDEDGVDDRRFLFDEERRQWRVEAGGAAGIESLPARGIADTTGGSP